MHAIKSLLSVNRKIHNCNIGRDKGLFILKDLEEYDLGKTVAGKFKKNFQKTSPVDTKAFQTCRHLETLALRSRNDHNSDLGYFILDAILL